MKNKKNEMFSVPTASEEFENATITGHLGIVFVLYGHGLYHDYCKLIFFEKASLSKCFQYILKREASFSNSSAD